MIIFDGTEADNVKIIELMSCYKLPQLEELRVVNMKRFDFYGLKQMNKFMMDIVSVKMKIKSMCILGGVGQEMDAGVLKSGFDVLLP